LVIQTNKAKTNPIQTQLLQRAKLMQSVNIQRIMKKNAAMGYEKTNPKKTQSKPICILAILPRLAIRIFSWTAGDKRLKCNPHYK